jgi:hypothetical protein
VLRRIAAGAPRPTPARRRRRLLLAVACALLAVPAAAAAVWLGLRHVEVQVRRGPLPPPANPVLGRRVSLAAAERIAGFRPLLPPALAGGRVYVDGARISIVRGRLLLAQVEGHMDTMLLKKIVGTTGGVERVRVGGHRGLWFPVAHAYLWLDRRDRVREDTPVRSGPALVWEQGERVLRLEGARSRRRALRVATGR